MIPGCEKRVGSTVLVVAHPQFLAKLPRADAIVKSQTKTGWSLKMDAYWQTPIRLLGSSRGKEIVSYQGNGFLLWDFTSSGLTKRLYRMSNHKPIILITPL